MKASRYNFFFPYKEDSNKLIAYNSRSSALALITKEKHKHFVQFCEKGIEIKDDGLISSLRQGLFLLDDDVDELNLIRFNMLNSRYSVTTLSLTIAPTSDCNFRCIYCYEKDVIKPTYMTEDTQDRIVELLHSKIGTITNVNVTWYGGEPLMAFDAVERLSAKLIAICEENKISYFANMITNGYLLTRDKIERFNDLKITSLQVTIDGMGETHNQRRPFVDGQPTFDVIMQNLKDNIDIIPSVSLRINVDKINLSSGEKVLEYLKENKMEHRIFPYLGKVSNDNDCYNSPDCLSMNEFSQEYFQYSLSVLGSENILGEYPHLKTNFCGADSMGTYVIGADGALYLCWSDIGVKERSFGNVNENYGLANKALLDYMLFDPTTSKLCGNCNLLPVCMGGCPFRRLADNNDKCSVYKYILENYLSFISSRIKKAVPTEPKEQEEAV